MCIILCLTGSQVMTSFVTTVVVGNIPKFFREKSWSAMCPNLARGVTKLGQDPMYLIEYCRGGVET